MLRLNDPNVPPASAPSNASSAQDPVPSRRPRRALVRYRGILANTVIAHRIEVAMYRLGLATADAAGARCGVPASVINRVLGLRRGWKSTQLPQQNKIAYGLELPAAFIVRGHLDAKPAWFDGAEADLTRSKCEETVSGVPFADKPLVHCLADAMMNSGGCWLALERLLSMTPQAMKSALLYMGSTPRLDPRKVKLLARLSGWSLEAVEAALDKTGSPAAPTCTERASSPATSTRAHALIPTGVRPPVPSAPANTAPAPRTPQPADPPVVHAAAKPDMDLNLAKRAVAWLFATAPSPFIRDTAGVLLPALMSSDSRPA